MPGICPSFIDASTWSCDVFFFRSLQGFVTMPPNPPVGFVSWKTLPFSGNERYTSATCAEKSFVWSSVEFGAA